MEQEKVEETREQEPKKKRGCGGALIIFIGIIAAVFFVVQRVTLKDEIQLYGQWHMTDESWEAELKYRKENKDCCFYKCVSFSGPGVLSPLKARFVAFDDGLKPLYRKISGTFVYDDLDGNDWIFCLAFGAEPWEAKRSRYLAGGYVEWVDFNTIVVRCKGNNFGEERTYRRIAR
ncbi:MAG: hypothetical protein IJO46_10375 [Thermoguttaceae bacterium]|nr:hypothetical protein [Thermoguttaceae bacterium]MBQ8286578.1 hypothetical protein [Thermoguttaceae bacterium]MBQ9126415.1 hypothetical protein [Thermoguttaceae bacterium]